MRNKLFAILILLSAVPVSGLQAQSAGDNANPFYMEHLFSNMLVLVSAVVMVAALLVILYLSNILLQMQKMEIMRQKGITPEQVTAAKVAKPNLLQRLYRRATMNVPLEKEKDILLDHDYDGIHELDNTLPPWWVWLFYITIIWGVFHMVYYVFTDMGPGSIERYEMIKAQAEEEVAEYLATKADLVDEKSVVTLTDEAALDKGKTIFISYCAACHGTQGEGGVGPNMTDNYWIHGGDIKDLFKVVKYGVPEKGMISWKSQLSPVQMQQVSSYILTLVGTNPPNQKEPQGELYEPASETAPEGEPATEG